MFSFKVDFIENYRNRVLTKGISSEKISKQSYNFLVCVLTIFMIHNFSKKNVKKY